jgi:pimeloyl-ACP methyl ester carboxylesterase
VTATITAEYIEARGIRIWMTRGGDGPPLLYLPGATADEDDPALTLLTTDFRVYRPDHPGFGRSDDDPAADSVLDLAFRYLDMLDTLALDRICLAGLSLGGWIAAQIAVLAPDRVTKLVLADPAGLRPPVPVPDIFTLDPVELAMLASHEPRSRQAAVTAARGMAGDPERFARYLRNRAATAHLAWNPYLHDPKLAGRLHRIACAVLLIWGAQDRLLPPDSARAWLEALPTARLELLENAGHRPQAEQPAAFAALVREFLT